MLITLEKDTKCNVDIQLCETLLNKLSKVISFKALPVRPLDREHSKYSIDFKGETDRIVRLLSNNNYDSDLHFFLTRRPFDDNFFVHQSKNTIIISFSYWEEYTSLPEENGFLHYIARYILLQINYLNHEDSTGCVFDYHWQKTDIDICIRQGRVCSPCHQALTPLLKNSERNQSIYQDAINILHAVANASRLGRSIYTVLTDQNLSQLNWETFEDYVADYYRYLGATVEQDCNMAGFQVDIVASEKTASGHEVRTIVECKFHKNKIGNRIINDFSRVFATIRDAGLANAGVVVSYSGFTQDAKLAAKHAGVTLLHYKDISHKFNEHRITLMHKSFTEDDFDEKQEYKYKNRVFVMMPFSSDFDDIYFFGIQAAIKDCGGVCVRMDEEQFNGGILEEIYRNIEQSSVIIAEVSSPNPNVYYEVGYAHALKREVVLLTNKLDNTPFDLSGFNHIAYSSIRDLSEKLRRRIHAFLSQHK